MISWKIKRYFIPIIEGKKETNILCRLILILLSKIYSLFWYLHYSLRNNFNDPAKLPVPVISIGNITWGGTGKTSVVLWILERIADKYKIGILTRGYGGDEDVMLKERFPQVLIGLGKNRVKRSKELIEKGAELLILDDGFQYNKIKKDLNVVLLDSSKPFGNNRLLPAGILREPVKVIEKADFVIFTHQELVNSCQGLEFELGIKQESIASGGYDIQCFEDFNGNRISIAEDVQAVAISGIAYPDSFKATLRDAHVDVIRSFDFPDHYPFSEKDILEVEAYCKNKNIRYIITTEKDSVRLKGFNDVFTVDWIILKVKFMFSKGEDNFVRSINHSCHKGIV